MAVLRICLLSAIVDVFLSIVTPLAVNGEVLVYGQQDRALSLMVNKSGSYEISVDGVTWFQSHDTFFTIDGTTFSSMAGTLKVIQGPDVQKKKHPRLGGMKEISLTWQAADAKKTKIVTSFQLYDENTAIAFTQNFSLSSLPNSSVYDANSICTSFPSVVVADAMRKELGYLDFDERFLRVQHLGKWEAHSKPISTGLHSTPLTLFNRTKYTMILSSFKQFMVSSLYHHVKDDAIQQGIMGKITEIPKGFIQQSIMQFGSGIKQTIMRWGKTLKTQYNTKRFAENDMTLKYLGYWTDAGAFYYYNTGPNITYEKTMLDVQKEAMKEFVPYKYYQIDSWWYFKGILSDGVKNWTAMPSIFPHNLSYVAHHLDDPIVAHNKYWTAETDYAKKNGGAWNFIVELVKAIPQDEEFWNFLLSDSKKSWNLVLYEQDWLDHQFEEMSCTLENVTVARKWLIEMGNAAMKNNLPIQYCMPLAKHLLQTVEIPHVTQARASDDYHPGNEQWNIGLSSIIYHALDLRPFKDNFRTNPANDHSPKYHPEPYPGLQTTVAVYSTGPVGPSDKIGFANVTRINRTINSDGLLLQPSRPMMAVDDYILGTAFLEEEIGLKGMVWTTYSNVSGFIYGAILVIDITKPLLITPKNVDLEMIDQSYIYLDESPSVVTKLFDQKHPATVGPTPEARYQLWHTAPVFKFNNQSWAILGDTSKYVPMSPDRFTDIKVDQKGIYLFLQMGPLEVVHLTVQTEEKTWKVQCEGAIAGGPLQIAIAAHGIYVCLPM